MPSVIDQLARGVRDLLNEAPEGTFSGLYANWSTLHPAHWRHLPAFNREDIADIRVTVSSDGDSSHGFDNDFRDRCCTNPFVHTVYVAVAKLAQSFDENLEEYSDQDELEALKCLVEEVAGYVYSNQLTIEGQTAVVDEINFDPFWDRTMWKDQRVFLSILSVTYRWQ